MLANFISDPKHCGAVVAHSRENSYFLQGLKIEILSIFKNLDNFTPLFRTHPKTCGRSLTTIPFKDTPGFVVNRLLIPMVMDSIRMLEQGVASAESIDLALKLGAAHPMGPLRLADYIGLDVIKNILDGESGLRKFRKDRKNFALRRRNVGNGSGV